MKLRNNATYNHDRKRTSTISESSLPQGKRGVRVEGIQEPEDALQRDPHMTIPELSELVGISERNISENLKKLQSYGLLERVGSRKKGVWKVNQR